MHYKLMKNIVAAALIGLVVSGPAYAQPPNPPSSRTQVPGISSGNVAAPPSTYILNGQSPLVNYVRERDGMGRITDTVQFAAAGFADVQETTHYFDGLGRPLQTVQRQHSPGNNPVDVVAPVVYDPFGREVYKYLPYVAGSGNTNDGGFKQDPFTDQQNFYQNVYPAEQPAYAGEQVYYGQTNYEASPLNRVLETMAPGNNWAGSGVGVSQQYLVNTTADSVVIWNVGNDTLTYQNNDITTNIPTSPGYYAPGQLYKNVTLDEQQNAVIEYKDKDGLVVLKKVQIASSASIAGGYTGWLSTYYIYDNLNQLRLVLSPKATNIIYSNGWNISADTTTINQLCFRYEYDGRQRMIARKVPGAGWTYMVYDMRDRPVFSQDANMRNRNQWMATLYDGENRSTASGMITYTGLPNQLQQYVTANTGQGAVSTVPVSGSSPAASVLVPNGLDLNSTENGDNQAVDSITWDNGFVTPDTVNFTAEIVPAGTRDTLGGSSMPFTNNINVVDNALPPDNNFIGLTMTFYDDYSNTTKQYTTAYNGLLDAGTNEHAELVPATSDAQAVQTIGLVTGTKVRVLENPNDLTQGNWLETASFYDDRARVVQTQSDNYKGGQDTMLTLHNFTNQAITTYLAHANPAATANSNTRIKTNIDLDFANRVLQVYETINDQDSTKRLLAQNAYDQLSQLQTRQLGQTTSGSFLETQDYAYNIRGWLKGINRDYANNDNSRGANNRWFGMDLSYDWGFQNIQLNGNIAGNKWRSKGDGQQRAYGFGYDDANRFMFADFNQYSGSGWDKTSGIDFSATMGDGGTAGTAYDANGNILSMKQMGLLQPGAGSSQAIDELGYTYYPNSNQLQNVIDTANNPTTTLGDFRTSSLSPYATGKTAAAIDYNYDVNGNLTRDLNKDIGSLTTNGIVYNHLNLPWRITFRSANGTKGTITYIYDARGNKLKKTTLDSAGNLQTVTTYIGAFQYQGRQALGLSSTPADTLQFVGQEEGRVRLKTDTTSGQSVSSWQYDYFLKDHLGNTRMVLTDEQETDQYPAATMEVGDSSLENLYYTNLDETRVALPPGYPTDTTTNPNQYVAQLYSPDGNPVIGPGIVLKVMAGDQFSIKTSSWYQSGGAAPGQVANPLTDIVSALIAGTAHIPGEGAAAGAMSNSPTLSPNVFNFLTDTGNVAIDQTRPHAFLNWILFDNQFNYVSASSGYQQVGASGTLNSMILTNLPVSESGFLYIYVSNTTPNVAVFFDNLQVTHVRGPLLEEEHYYPFGLTMAGISDKAVKWAYAENKYRFQKQELQNKEFSDGSGLELYEFKYRFDDPQIGRFGAIDPLANKYVYNSPYAFSEDKVTGDVELEGLEGVPFGTQMFRAAGISSSSDPIKFVQDVGKEALKPQNWAMAYGIVGATLGAATLVGIMSGGTGEGALMESEIGSVRVSLTTPSEAPIGGIENVPIQESSMPVMEGGQPGTGTLNPTLPSVGNGTSSTPVADNFTLNSAPSSGLSLGSSTPHSPSFIVDPGGTAFPVPNGATGPVPNINTAGNQTGVKFTGGSGGANGQVTTMRLMDPTPPRGTSPGYPNGYIKYMNRTGQGVDPYTGRTLPNAQNHFRINH